MSREDYLRGWDDGVADRGPDIDRMALGANFANDYERGYLDSGLKPVCPECTAGKHGNCDGTAWDEGTDSPTSCACELVEHQMARGGRA